MYLEIINSAKYTEPECVTFDSRNERIIVTSYKNKIQFFDKNLKRLKNFRNSKHRSPAGICLQSATNNIITAEFEYIQIFDNENYKKINHLYTIHSQKYDDQICDSELTNVVCNNKGHIISADIGNHNVIIFNEKGCFVRRVEKTKKIPARFYTPRSVCTNNNQIIIIDNGNVINI